MLQISRIILATILMVGAGCDPKVEVQGALIPVVGVQVSPQAQTPQRHKPQGPISGCCHCSGNNSCGKAGGLPPCPSSTPPQGPGYPPQQEK